MIVKEKRAQITIFVIIAVILVALIAILFYPKIKEALIPSSPGELIPRACIEKAVRESLSPIMESGGILNPQLYFRYNNESIAYLCYTSQWYKTCSMQVPLLKQTIEKQVNANTQTKINECINQMESQLKAKGYEVRISGSRVANIELVPGKIKTSFDFKMIIQKANGEPQVIPAPLFRMEFNSGYYDLVIIATSILNYEARYGDSFPESFMSFYPNLRIEKKRQDDGTKVYLMSDRETNEKLNFATRSLAWPAGYSLE